MNSLTKSLAKDLKLLLKKFPDKTSINLYDAKQFISKSLNLSIDLLDDDLIHNFLKQKGYKEIIKNKKNKELEKNIFDIDSIDLDMDLDDILDLDLTSNDDLLSSMEIEEVHIDYNHKSYSKNKTLLSEHAKTKDPVILQKLITNNRSLVYKFASFYNKMIIYNSSLDEEDLIQAGMIGLYNAINKYDLDKGAQFSTYAVFWIKQAITREIMNNGNVVRLPVHLGQDLMKLHRLESDCILKFGHVDMDYVCNEMNISYSKYNSLKEIDYKFSKMKSIDICVNDENSDTSIIDLLDSSHALVSLSDDFLDPMEVAMKNIFSKNLLSCLDKLTEKERDIILLRFGFIDGAPHTLEDIGSRYNVTRERIRQIEAKALKKLRKSKSLRQIFKNEDDSSQKTKKNSSKKINTLSKSKSINAIENNTKSSNNKNKASNKKLSNASLSKNLKISNNITTSARLINNSKTSNKKSTNSSKKVTTVKNSNSKIVKNANNQTTKPYLVKKSSIKYNVDNFKKEVSKELFNKLKSKYNGEYLLAEEYSQFALSIKVFHTKCGNEFYTNPSTILNKRPICPFCGYKE